MLPPLDMEKDWPLFRSKCLQYFKQEKNVTEEIFKQLEGVDYWNFFYKEYIDYLKDIPIKGFPKWFFLNDDFKDLKVSFKQWLFTERDYYLHSKTHNN